MTTEASAIIFPPRLLLSSININFQITLLSYHLNPPRPLLILFLLSFLFFVQTQSIMAHSSIIAHLKSRRARNHSSSILERLPFELLRLIARQLPLSSAASLSFSSKSICYVVGLQYWHDLSSQTLEKEKFLAFIEKDHPGYWLCHVCTILHPRPYRTLDYNGNPPCRGTRHPVPKCIRNYGLFGSGFDDTSGLNTWYPYLRPTLEITHPMVHVAMNRHLFGPSHGDSLDVFFKPFQEDVINRANISTQARIIANEFYLRWQYRVVIPSSKDFDQVWNVDYGVCICPHIHTALAGKDIITRISECMLSHRNTGACQKCNRPIQCHSCLTEFEVSIHNLEHIGHVLEFTAWKNFGSGRSPKDPKWTDHVWKTARNKAYLYLGDPFEYSQGIIRSAFESH